ncbi:SDR family oxidoreductase [Nocardia sp. R6R-6]|uniref:SDR family oxidoreductase n=1 Tax=Nocardia sp. R6R-6 TaxID=3459303 RepID=UPI00403D89EF
MKSTGLEGQHAVVTGAARGIGFAVAERLVREGAQVTIWDRDPESVPGAVAALERLDGARGVSGAVVDQQDFDQVVAAQEATRQAYGDIHILVNNAGIAGPTMPLVDYPLEDWREIMATDLDGVFHCLKAVVPQMIEQGYGRIVNVSSVAGKEGNPNAAAYSAAKAGVIALTKSLAKEVAKLDIAVNAVTPATARTRILEQFDASQVDYMLERIPRGRFLRVEEAADMILWMVRPENSFTTGAVFDLSGGRTTY